MIIDRSTLPPSCTCIEGDELPPGQDSGFFAFYPNGRLRRLAHYRDGELDRADDVLELARDEEQGICHKPFLNVIYRYRDGQQWIEPLDEDRSKVPGWIKPVMKQMPKAVAWADWVQEQVDDLVAQAWARYDASSLPPDYVTVEGDDLPPGTPDGPAAWFYEDGQLRKLARVHQGRIDRDEVVLELAQGKKEGRAWIPQWAHHDEHPQPTLVETYQRRTFTRRVESGEPVEHPCAWTRWVERSLAYLAHAPYVKIDASYLPQRYEAFPSMHHFLEQRLEAEPLYNRYVASFYDDGQLEFYAYVRDSHMWEIQWMLHLEHGRNAGSLEVMGMRETYERGCVEENDTYGDGVSSFPIPVARDWETWVKESIKRVRM
jgi:hypothetical protein